MPVLEVRELVAEVPSFVPDPVSFRLQSGESLGITGPSGAGKSVCLRAVAGLTPRRSGTITLDGEPPGAQGWTRFRRRVLYLAQRPVFADTTVRAALARPFAFRSQTRDFDEGRAARMLESVGLHARQLDDEPRSLSGGQQLRVALVRAFLLEPDFVLLDEPTSGLDPETSEEVEDFWTKQLETGALGLVLVTHDPAQATRTTRAVELTPGIEREAG